jgi:hypothetical protein
MSRYGAAVLMLGLGIFSLVLHFAFGWNAFQREAESNESSAAFGPYLITWGRDVFENLQSEFIQLFFQFLLLAGFFRALGIRAYEEDVEEVKQRVERVERSLELLASRQLGGNGQIHPRPRREAEELVGV